MIKHIVLFKLKETLTADEKRAVGEAFKAAIEALPAKISNIRHIEVGLNINETESFDVALSSEFDTLDDVKSYSAHPDHVAAAAIIKAHASARSCVDYEF